MKKNLIQKIKCLLCGVLLLVPLFPHQIFAVEENQIVPTWNWGSQYANQFTVTNFCEGSGTSTSCELRFTANNSYYGYLWFDGYNGNTKWINGKYVWIADGYGAYRYSLYQNGVIQINKINIEGGFLKSSIDNLNIQDIIDLLTAIETDTTSIDNQLNTELQRLQSIINNQITQNGYLQTLTRMRQWHIPIESYLAMYFPLSNYNIHSFNQVYDYDYPFFDISQNDDLFYVYSGAGQTVVFIFYIDLNLQQNNLSQYIDTSIFQTFELSLGESLYDVNYQGRLFKLTVKFASGNNYHIKYIGSGNRVYCPIYYNYLDKINVSTDFALRFNLNNRLLNYLQIIAEGTSASTSSSNDLENSADDIVQNSSTMFNFENQQNQNMNNALQNINTNYDIGSFGSSFLASANWVRTQFDNITSSTPFGSVLSFSLLLGLALLIIGKVYK